MSNLNLKVSLSFHLSEEPRMLLCQLVKVGMSGHVGIAEPVLDGRRRADVLVEELLSRLLGDGFGRHDCLGSRLA